VTFRISRMAHVLGFLAATAISATRLAAQSDGPRPPPVIAFSQPVAVEGAILQIDFAEGKLDLPRSEIVQRIETAAHAVAVYYGRFPVPRARILVIPVAGRHGVLQGTTWGNMAGSPAFLRLRIGEATSQLPSLPDDQHWLEEGIASYVEPVARVQAGQISAAKIWADMRNGMPNGEPGPHDRGLDVTHTWGRTYWGGALFCLSADVEIRKQTGNRRGLQDALRGVVAAGGSIDKEWPLSRILSIGDQATGTHVLADMYAQWSQTPIPVDLPQLWGRLGVRAGQDGVTFDPSAPLAAIRVSITAPDRLSAAIKQ
jgi:hypothetical protein